MASSLRRRPQDPGRRESLKREGPLEGGGPTKARPACARPQRWAQAPEAVPGPGSSSRPWCMGHLPLDWDPAPRGEQA